MHQVRLQCRRDIAYFVQNQRAFIGHFEAPDLLSDGSGKGTLLVTEQFAFQKIQRNGRAIEFYESAPDALTCIVNGMRDEFFSRAGFPLDEDSRISASHLLYLFENRFQGGALADDPLESSIRSVSLRVRDGCTLWHWKSPIIRSDREPRHISSAVRTVLSNK